jgi:hypothetical protein
MKWQNCHLKRKVRHYMQWWTPILRSSAGLAGPSQGEPSRAQGWAARWTTPPPLGRSHGYQRAPGFVKEADVCAMHIVKLGGLHKEHLFSFLMQLELS